MLPDLLLVSVLFGMMLLISLPKMVKYVQWQNRELYKKSHNLLVLNSKKFQSNKSLSFSKTLNLTFLPQKCKVDILTWSSKKI